MMETAEKKSRSDRQTHSNSLLPYFLASVLIHGLIVSVIAFKERSNSTQVSRSQITAKQKQNKNSIEFVVLPPEKTQDKPPPKTKRRAETNSVAQGKIKSERSATTRDRGNTAIDSPISQSKAQRSPISAPPKIKPTELVKPNPPVASKPESVKPSLSSTEKKDPIVSSFSQPKIPSQEGQTISKKNDSAQFTSKLFKTSRSTRQFPSTAKSKIPATSSLAKKTPTNSGAASLLGGKYQRSLKQDSGSAFFAAQSTGSKESPYAKLDAQQDDLGPYFARIKRRVKKNWQPSSANQEEYTVLTFAIERNGVISGLKIAKTSGDEQVDRDALEAVQKSSPFGTLPQSFKGDRLPVEFSFNIFIDRGSFSPSMGNIFP
jgi:periplasmic protein TonB